ncbi:biotin-dependent carboxyltransferase family protein [Liquorilactobacillus satsumensis]|uniref:Carboxyltransferase domain-containing protein n=1 Tax=Liquorilactobacillus satsumensis DSM 16230 = JCM 12392 TaxID=1423801 RepID=A0A0R1UV37_9LACO|nr:biotin-dependent carboxyltransferase family protein [Liquorilactobacillus satsumensis]KRL96935.1 hypothetical protein FD50_GL001877 [Liquorilactobacillus satsumensis DSM 16230 = JCM 12392]MCP9312444.1 biotin-dependent carboxyltransferase family protein [Liquorilactobacillus satsumensis]MCP9329031.1 biotin-dependent carboxyltransferase family protein [Liquorilactobacillus satsumensis]MCP9359733.1 biotin-dependent carboxyltransferase family protein [Liquorilactobacillus satsumensis]
MAQFEILAGGLATTVQDTGRRGYQAQGIPVSGATDLFAHQLANLLVNNPVTAATLEFMLLGPKIKFNCHTFIAVTGGASNPCLNGKNLSRGKAYAVHCGDILSFSPMAAGRFGYLALAAGGILTAPLLQSRSTTVKISLGGYHGRKLAQGDLIPHNECFQMPSLAFRQTNLTAISQNKTVNVRFMQGPQWQLFSTEAQAAFTTKLFNISPQADRMGYRLAGDNLPVPNKNMLSEGTVLGNIQITRAGEPIVLLTDRQTAGGYPVIGTIIAADLSMFTQLTSEQKIHFKQVTLATATQALENQRASLKKLAVEFKELRYQQPLGPARKAAPKITKLIIQNQ